MALVLSKLFMRSISQNPNENQTGVSLWTIEDIEKAQAKQKALALAPNVLDDVPMHDDDGYGDGGLSDHLLVEMDLDIE